MMTHTPSKIRKAESGFTLLEVILSISILMVLTLAFSSMLKNSVDLRRSLAQDSTVTHRMANAINLMSNDIQHAYMVSVKDQARNGISRRTKTIFKIDTTTISDKLTLTTMTHQAINSNAKESDSSLVLYEVKDDSSSGKKGLYRGETKMVPEDLKEEPTMRMLMPGVKSVKFLAWDGEKFVSDRWDSGRGEWRDKLPRMVKIELEAFEREPEEETSTRVTTNDTNSTAKYSTIVYLAYANGMAELKTKPASIKWQ